MEPPQQGERKMPNPKSESVESNVQKLDKVKLILNLAFIIFVVLIYYTEAIYLYFRPPHPGEMAYLTFRAQSYYYFDQEKIFKGLRDSAIAQHIPIYIYAPTSGKSLKKEMNELTDAVHRVQSQGRAGREAFAAYLKKEFGLKITSEDAVRLLRYPDLQNLLAGILTIQESIFQSKIVQDPAPLQGKMTVQVLYPDPIGISTFPANEITTLEKARSELQDKVHKLFWQVEPSVLNPLLQMALANLQPNLKYDPKKNKQIIEEKIQQYPLKIITYKPGDVLVPFHHVLSMRDVLMITASQEAERKDLYGRIPWILFIIGFSVLLYNLLLSKILAPCWRLAPPYRLFLFVLALTILILKAILLFTPFPVYVLPFAILPLLLTLLYREKVSLTFTTVLGAILVSLFSGHNLIIFLYLIFGGLVAILTSFGIRKRSNIFLPAFLVGIANAAVVLLLFSGPDGMGLTFWQADFSSSLPGLMSWALVGGLAAGPLALLLLPLLELSWHNASVFKLNKFSDLQQPLMIELLTKTPGTYQHAMTVAHLACALGGAIGADSLLLRVAAYYHDIGKTANPDFYVENLFGKKSPHDDLPALESTKIIMDHVRNGKKIALEAGVPEMVADFIPQHHGTLLIEYFYDKAIKENPGAVINEKDFRYPGPKPQSVEAAILMIVDAVEATSRTIEEPTCEKIEAMIRHIIQNRIADGQFDECNLSTSEIAQIVDVLMRSLEAAFHTRVEYPWQQKEKNASRTDNGEGTADAG